MAVLCHIQARLARLPLNQQYSLENRFGQRYERHQQPGVPRDGLLFDRSCASARLGYCFTFANRVRL